MIYILNYNEKVPKNSKIVSTTTKSTFWSRGLSPMIVGPVDSDAYNHVELGYTYNDVLNNLYKKMGHAFVLAMMLDGHI